MKIKKNYEKKFISKNMFTHVCTRSHFEKRNSVTTKICCSSVYIYTPQKGITCKLTHALTLTFTHSLIFLPFMYGFRVRQAHY